MSMIKYFLIIFSSLWFTLASSANATTPDNAAMQSEIITLKYRLPDEMIPMVQPFLSKDAKIKGFEDKLIIQASNDNMAMIKKLIEEMDVPPKKLFISVSNGHDKPSEIMTLSPNGEVNFGSEESGSSATVYSTSRQSDRQVDSIQVNDGQTASFKSGVTIPLIQQSYFENAQFSANYRANDPSTGARARGRAQGTDQTMGQSYDYQNLENGIFVRPQVIGTQVKLHILTQNDQPSSNFSDPSQPSYTTFKGLTTMTVPLGKWVYFGGNQTQQFSPSGLSAHTSDSSDQSKRDVWVRVDLIAN